MLQPAPHFDVVAENFRAGVAQLVLIPRLPVKFADVAEGVPWLAEHTDDVLTDGVIGP